MIKEVKTKHLFIVLIVVSFLYNYQNVLKDITPRNVKSFYEKRNEETGVCSK
jgi:hypothetical protein